MAKIDELSHDAAARDFLISSGVPAGHPAIWAGCGTVEGVLEEPAAIILVGPSSVGKTTTARALQHKLRRPSLFFSGDDFDLPPASEAVRFLRGLSPQEFGSWERTFYRSFFAAVAAVRASGLHAIGEMIFKSPAHIEECAHALGDDRTVLVRLTAGADVRLQRERERGDRLHGTALRTAVEDVPPPKPSLTIDTSGVTPDEVAARIISLL